LSHPAQRAARSLLKLLEDRGLTLATAESCTAGLLGKMITDVPGASAVYLGGWIVYSNDMKWRQLGVPKTTLRRYRAVSEPVALKLAIEALRRSGADLSVAITGIAGPEGGTRDKPVGTVWIAVSRRETPRPRSAARPNTAPPIASAAWRFRFRGSRAAIRHSAALHALDLVHSAARGESIGRPAVAAARRTS
jgi:nicotinamide-nucleotide amidase